VPIVRVFACECQPIVLEGLASLLGASPDLELAGSALSTDEVLATLSGAQPDVILVCEDFEAPVTAHHPGVLRSLAPQARLILWTNAPDSHPSALEIGFSGIVDKRRPVGVLLECLRAVAQGACWRDGHGELPEYGTRRGPPRLTRREREIALLVGEGRKNREIADTLSISPGTVKVHLMHIFEKAGVEDRLQLALLARRLLSPEPEEPARAEVEPALVDSVLK